MHLALLTPEWFPTESGGIGTYARVFAGSAAALGHEVTVVAATSLARDRQGPIVPGVRVVPVLADHHSAVSVSERFREEVTRLVLSGWRPDAVEAADYCGVGALLSGIEHLPSVITRLHTPLTVLLSRNEGQRIYRDDRERCQLEAQQIANSVLLTSPTSWLANEVRKLWDVVGDIPVVPNPVELRSLSRTAPHDGGPIRLLFVGRLEYRKGVHILASGFRHWLERGGCATLTMIGGDTKWRGTSMALRVKDALGPFASPSHFTYLGYQPQVILEEQMRSADLVVLPSLYENMAYTCVEAMAVGTPVLAASGSGFEEVLSHEVTGYLAKPNDPSALARALAEYTKDRNELVRVGIAGQRALHRFDARETSARLCDLYARSSR